MTAAIIACVISLLVGFALGWVGSTVHARRKALDVQRVRDIMNAYLLATAPEPIPFHPEPGTPEAEMLESIQETLDKNVDDLLRRNERMKQDIEQWLADNPEGGGEP